MLEKLNSLLITGQFKLHNAMRLLSDVTTGGGDDGGDGGAAADFLDGFGQPTEDDAIFGDATKAAKTLGNSIYSLLFYIVIMGASIAILVVALKMIFGGNQTKAEGKSALIYIIAGLALAACAVSLVAAIVTGAGMIFS